MKAAAIILSGGNSRRMGTNKALLKINEKTTIERIAGELRGFFDDILLVTNEPEVYRFLGLKMVPDHYPGRGPLAGVHAGLTASECEVNFVVACDMPFVSGQLAASLVNKVREYDAVVPVISGKQHPLYAVYNKKIAGRASQCIVNGQLRMKKVLDQLNVLFVTEEDLQTDSSITLDHCFFNMNHPEEYEEAKKWAEFT
ncbi:molybdenum cofactor guanylyltransferase [Neobacillus ginsengisoli]|uniref:Probable molybdenum cofactor guanylyltransferase n=1 Tax=Neobacillus ginsengisoli TaxID=904295 RepID=A0ABT9XZC8_9BACI|nr:molybdenum cofactor guanylyltransferase [Neobacillus ginsengisoli]MDQ0200927.1 molybdopterin-guanine dinucleotide biosynthesis protein A [Neobacillus ginsengisoli]